MSMHFDDDMIVLEKWDAQKPITVIYWEGEKELFYVKRFLIDNPEKDEVVITDHPKSYLEKVFTDYRPVAEIVFVKERGKDRKDNIELNLEEFISVKGITAMGNQLTKDKVLEINAMESLPFTPPEPIPAEELEVVDEEELDNGEEETLDDDPLQARNSPPEDTPPRMDDEGQITLF
jgi:topoisomerase IV subunit A